MERLTAEGCPDEQAVGFQRPAALDQLANRIVGPVQSHQIQREVVLTDLQRQGFVVRHHLCRREARRPEIGKSGHQRCRGKRLVNQGHTILDLIRDHGVKKQRVFFHALAVPGKGRRVRHGRVLAHWDHIWRSCRDFKQG